MKVFSLRPTFCEVDVSGPVLGPILRLEIHHESLDALLARGDQVDGLHGRERLPTFLDRLHD